MEAEGKVEGPPSRRPGFRASSAQGGRTDEASAAEAGEGPGKSTVQAGQQWSLNLLNSVLREEAIAAVR